MKVWEGGECTIVLLNFSFFSLGLWNLQIADHNWGVGAREREDAGRIYKVQFPWHCSTICPGERLHGFVFDLATFSVAQQPSRDSRSHSNRQQVVADSCQACLTRPCSENKIDCG